ncbi:MAG: class I SAM-dependent methyltransferase [Solirubrobacterales bacterium]
MRSRVTSLLLAALRRAQPNRTVMVSEYTVTPAARWGWGEPAHERLAALFARGEGRYASAIDRLVAGIPTLSEVERHADPPAPSWDNDFWGGLDAAFGYLAIADRRPATYLEVGSGYSTMLARRAVDSHSPDARIVSVDPNPRAEIDALCDEVIRKPLEEAGPGVADRIRAGDVIVIDGSHMATMGSDTVVALLELLPELPAGVLVAIDDVFLPWDYHPTWVERWYGEQYIVAALLLGGGAGYEIVFPGLYVTQHPELAPKLEPLWPVVGTRFGKVAGTLWLERPDAG